MSALFFESGSWDLAREAQLDRYLDSLCEENEETIDGDPDFEHDDQIV